MPKRKDRTRPKARWVYRGHLGNFVTGQTVALDNETYDITIFSIPSSSGFQAFSLYDSDAYVENRTGGNIGAGQGFAVLPAAARPGGERPKVLAVRGTVEYEPSAWALGNAINLGFRIGILEQDASDGTFIGVPGYGMWGTSWSDQPAQHALGAANLWERRRFKSFNSQVTNPVYTEEVNVNFGRGYTLGPKFGLSFGVETNATSVALRVRLFLATLVSDD